LKLGESVYGAQASTGGGDAGANGATGGQPGKSASGENVVDADFEEVKDDKKKKA
jgi:molecular chaperone DnaK